jgi:hypothetical protein
VVDTDATYGGRAALGGRAMDLDRVKELASQWPPKGAWLNKKMLAEPPSEERQCAMYLQDLKISCSDCVICRMPRFLGEDQETWADADTTTGAKEDEDEEEDEDDMMKGMEEEPLPASFIPGQKVKASYGFVMGKPTRCRTHRLGLMTNVSAPFCQVEGCNRRVCGDGRCTTHGGNLCIIQGCSKAQIRHGPKPDHCTSHGGGFRCAGCGDVSVPVDGATCWGCRRGKPRFKRFETLVDDFLHTLGPLGLYSYRDERMPCAPIRNLKKPDWVWILQTHVVVLECDEDCHQFYDREQELQRIVMVWEQMQGHTMILLRFNPLVRHLKSLRDALWIAVHDPPPQDKIDVRFIGYPEHMSYELECEMIQGMLG